MSVQQAPLYPYSQDARPEASPVSLAWCLAAWALVTQSTIVAIQALAAITFAVSMPTAEFSLRTDTAVHVPTALTCSARAIGITVTYSTLAAAKAWGRAMHRVITILTHNWLSHTTTCTQSLSSVLDTSSNSYTRIFGTCSQCHETPRAQVPLGGPL